MRVHSEIAELVAEFRRIVNGMQMLGYRPPRAVDEAIAVGERLSALLVSEHLRLARHRAPKPSMRPKSS